MARFREFLASISLWVDARAEMHACMFTRLLVRLFLCHCGANLDLWPCKASFPQSASTQPHGQLEGRVCELFRQGDCGQGSECPFLHVHGANGTDSSPASNVEGDTDALTQANESSAGLTEEPARKPKVIPDTQTLLCKYFAQGLCKHGDDCQFRHGGVQLFTNSSSSSPFVATAARTTENASGGGWMRRPTMQCKFYAEGNCIRGEACTFLHGAHSMGAMNAPRHWSRETNAKDNENHWSYNTDAVNENQGIGDAVGWGDSWDNNDDSTPTAETGGDTHWASLGDNAGSTNDTIAHGRGDNWGDDNDNGILGSSSTDRAVGWDKTSDDIDAPALGWGDSWGNTDANDVLSSGADQGSTSNDALSTAPGWGDSWGDNNLGGSNVSRDSESNEASEAAPGWGDADATNGWGTISTKHGVGSTASNDKGIRKDNNAEAYESKLDKPHRQSKPSRALERANSNEDEARTNPTTTCREVCKMYLKGTCTLGTKCQMSHDRQHPRLCRYGSQAECPRGRKCYFAHESNSTPTSSRSQNYGGRDTMGRKQVRSPARDPLPHFSRKPSWTYTLKPEDLNAAKFVEPSPTEGPTNFRSDSLPPKLSTTVASAFGHPPGLPVTPVASPLPVSHPREFPLPVSPLLLSPHLVSLSMAPLLPCDIPLPPSPLSPHRIPLPLSPITPPGLPYLPSPRSIPLPPSPLNSVCDSLDGRPDAELPQGSPGHVTEETSPPSDHVMTPCHYFKQGYCQFEDRCRFLHTLEEGIDEFAHIPAERRDDEELDLQVSISRLPKFPVRGTLTTIV